jgi:hypothetical protein
VETVGRLALDEDAEPERLMPPPCPIAMRFADDAGSLWWTDGGPRVEPTRLSLPSLPDAACFATMLGHLAPTESGS